MSFLIFPSPVHVSSIICVVFNKERTKNINRQFPERSIRKDFNFSLHQKRQIKITEKYSVTYQTERVGEDEKKTSQVEVQVGTMSLEDNFRKKTTENISVLWPRDYPSRGITLRPQKACKKTMLINVMAKIVQ